MPVKNTTNTLDELQTDVSKVVSEGLKERKNRVKQIDRNENVLPIWVFPVVGFLLIDLNTPRPMGRKIIKLEPISISLTLALSWTERRSLLLLIVYRSI